MTLLLHGPLEAKEPIKRMTRFSCGSLGRACSECSRAARPPTSPISRQDLALRFVPRSAEPGVARSELRALILRGKRFSGRLTSVKPTDTNGPHSLSAFALRPRPRYPVRQRHRGVTRRPASSESTRSFFIGMDPTFPFAARLTPHRDTVNAVPRLSQPAFSR